MLDMLRSLLPPVMSETDESSGDASELDEFAEGLGSMKILEIEKNVAKSPREVVSETRNERVGEVAEVLDSINMVKIDQNVVVKSPKEIVSQTK